MSCPESRPQALFSLVPLNPRAERVVEHPANGHLVSTLEDGTRAINIGHVNPIVGGRTTLATMGRMGDVFITGADIARIQCSFERDSPTNVIMFHDQSNSRSSRVFGDNATPFEPGRPRKVVVNQLLNTQIGFGGARQNLLEFELVWHGDAVDTMEKVQNRESAALEENPNLARTINEADTLLPSRRETRPHTAGPQQPRIRYDREGKELGSGQFGVVYKATNMDTGELMAVKIVKRATEAPGSTTLYNALKREAETLSRINHPNIVDYIASQGWNGPEIEIFMGLKDGTLESLVDSKNSLSKDQLIEVSNAVFHQMLKALDFLAMEGIMHRDVKPENILYSKQSDQYIYQLGDFGFCDRAGKRAVLKAGSQLYMAPEMFDGRRQTHKVDVWSLFVTMLWTVNVDEFRRKSAKFRNPKEVQKAVSLADGVMSELRDMRNVDPEKRASAAQMLVKCFHGDGLTTPRRRIPDLVSPAQADTMALAATEPASASNRRAQPRTQRRAQ
ncbi:Calcium/calmodulin-dependent protein kinase I [Paramyrothecium foliicola]|nr:Calcium/calmodulin-dependent protein kinase I [Paramyrothecium foliicola]